MKKEKITSKDDDIIVKEIEKRKIPKEMSQEILKKMFKNLILAVIVIIYFITSNILYKQLSLNNIEIIMKVFSGVFLFVSIIMFEKAYKKDSGTLTITGIELLILSIHSLFIHHIVTVYQYEFRIYLLTTSYIFAMYYVLKSIIIYTKAKRKYLKSLSDISEIVKKDPVVKEAKKRRNDEQEIEVKQIENKNAEIQDKIEKYNLLAKKDTQIVKEKDKVKTKEKTKKEKDKVKTKEKVKKEKDKEEKTKEKVKKEKDTVKTKEKTKKDKNQEKANKEIDIIIQDNNQIVDINKKELSEEKEEIKKPKPKSKRGRRRKEEGKHSK